MTRLNLASFVSSLSADSSDLLGVKCFFLLQSVKANIFVTLSSG